MKLFGWLIKFFDELVVKSIVKVIVNKVKESNKNKICIVIFE